MAENKGPIEDEIKPVPSAPLAPSSELLQVLVDTLSDYAIILLDEKGVVLTWNAAAERLKGWKANEIVGQSFTRFYPPEEVAKGKTDMELKVAREQGRFEDEGRAFARMVPVFGLMSSSRLFVTKKGNYGDLAKSPV